jgi:hypothetical protein
MDKDLMRKEVRSFSHVLLFCPCALFTACQNLSNFGLDNSVDAAQVSLAAQEQEKEKMKYKQGWTAGTDFRKIREARKAAEDSADRDRSRSRGH